MGGAPGQPVALTGAGVVSPIGNTLAAFDAALFAGARPCGHRRSICPASSCRRCRWRAPISMPRRCRRLRACRSTGRRRWPWSAARDAAQAAGLEPGGFDPERLGIFWGSGMAGAATFETTCRTVFADRRRMRPTSVVTTMPNAPVAELSLHFGARGAALAYACACASSAVAIGEAMRAIRAGWIDVAIAGGSESMLTPGVLASWQAMRVLVPLRRGGERCRRGGGLLPAVRCRAQRLRPRRGGRGLRARVAGACGGARRARSRRCSPATRPTATACTSPSPMPPGQARAMQAALADAGLAASDIGYLNAHGTATTTGDAAEAESIARVFGAGGVPVSSTKAIHGHLLGAGGAVELLAALRALAPAACRRRRTSMRPTRRSRSTWCAARRAGPKACAR